MRTIDGYPDPKALTTSPVGRVTVDGVTREVSELSVTRSLGTGLPSSVAGVDDMVAADGKARLLPAAVVSEGISDPWALGEKVTSGAPVKVELGLNDAGGTPRLAPVLTGRVDGVGSELSDHSREVSFIDRIDRFRRRISMDPLHYRHPGPMEFDAPMDMGLHPAYLTDRIARHCGFYATPPLNAGAVVSAPMMGSVWPERGELIQAGVANTQFGSYPTYASTAWGLGIRNASATYRPNFAGGQNGSLGHPLHVHFLIGELVTNDHVARIQMLWEDQPGLTSANRIIVRVSKWGLSVDVVSVDGTDAGTHGSSNQYWWPFSSEQRAGGEFWVRVSETGGVTAARDGIVGPSGSVPLTTKIKTAPMRLVQTFSRGDGADIGGVQVLLSSNVSDVFAWKRTSIIETDPQHLGMLSVPAIANEECLSLLKSQAKGELAAIWLDEEGRFHYRSRARQLAQPVVDEITLDHIHGLSWSSDWASVASGIRISYKYPNTRRSDRWAVTAHEHSSRTYESNGTYEEIIHSGDDVDWIRLSPIHILNSETQTLTWFNRGHRSWVAGVIEKPDGTTLPGNAGFVNAGAQKMDPKSWLLRTVVTNLASGDQLTTKSPGWQLLRESKRGNSTPVIRAMAVTERQDMSYAIELNLPAPLNSEYLGEFQHDAGWWVQREVTARALALSLGDLMATPRPVMSEVPVTPDDRRQLADVYRVKFGDTSMKCLCVSITDELSDSGRTQTLALQPIEIEEN